ncbi:uncharacterized protein LOC119560651 isoform X3 [Drosophila subpulchrella]|uniref:uncharacterized protein LOC119560651 isoform X3 n=1 Tax=Drosophila subpulchrella TaxID=1486046 RepID=UPI0018A164F2|nr:uncharacterized protein LOC119560651 isoform X3 [Drosophila subpulchrella]
MQRDCVPGSQSLIMYSAQEQTNQKKRQPVPSNRLQLFNLKSGSGFLKFAPETSKEYLRLNNLKNRSFNAKILQLWLDM